MSVTVKRISFWRSEVNNKPGVLSRVLGPLAESQADLEVLMGYRYPGDETQAAIELFPVDGNKASTAAKRAGLAPAAHTCFHGLGLEQTGACLQSGQEHLGRRNQSRLRQRASRWKEVLGCDRI